MTKHLYKDHARGYNTQEINESSQSHMPCPNFFKQYIARNFKKEIAYEENTTPVAKAASLRDKSLQHLQLCKPNIYPVEIGKNVTEEKGMEVSASQLVVCLAPQSCCAGFTLLAPWILNFRFSSQQPTPIPH